jgi:hypothetical protein
MSTPSLGEILRDEVLGKKAGCLLELEQQVAAKGVCAQRDLEEVQNFFHQAITQFTNSILARIEIKPLTLGNGQNEAASAILQTYRWKHENGISQPSHPYHAVWWSFAAWCDQNDLHPEIEYRVDCSGKQYWYVLKVSPKQKIKDGN